jgi:hypothetical protein
MTTAPQKCGAIFWYTDSVIITLDIPEKVSSNAAYAGMHWSKRKELADLYHPALIEHRGEQWKTPLHLTFTFSFKGKLLDCSNCFLMAKCLEDSLVINGIIPDDTPAIVAGITIYVAKGNKDTVAIQGTSL